MSGNRRAAIIGINVYHDQKIEPLSGAVNDATELRDLLQERGGFTIDGERHFLTDQQATGERIRRAISDLFWKTEECEIALLFFAGHGRRDHLENGFLLPHDVHYNEPFVRGIEIGELKRLFLRAEPKTTGLMILDCCYSGIATKPERNGSTDGKSVESFYKALDLEGTGSGRYILASADADKTAREEAREHALGGDKHVHGLFSFQLIEGLQSGAKDEAGRVSLGALVQHLERAFPADSKHRPQLAVGSGVGLHEIFLATAAEETQIYIQSRLDDVRSRLDDGTPRNLMLAVRDLNALRNRGLWNDEADLLAEELQNRIEQLRAEIVGWWLQNSVDLPMKCQNSEWFTILRDAVMGFRYETIRLLENRKLTFLIECVQDIRAGKPPGVIGEYIVLMDRDRRMNVGVGDATGGQKAAKIVS